MLLMDIEEIKAKVRANQYVYTHHAEVECRAEELGFRISDFGIKETFF